MNRCIIHYIVASLIAIVLFMIILHVIANSSKPLQGIPKLMYWAWEAPQELSKIDPINSGVAELAASIYIRGKQPYYYLRKQPLRAPVSVYRMAVIHIEARVRWRPVLDQKMAEQIAIEINNIYKKQAYDSLQIDFEPLNGQREFYQKLLIEVRKLMGNELFLSITGLASWCTSDGWIGRAKLPVDLVIPMYFSISKERHQRQAFISRFPHSISRLAPECHSAVGLATFETWQVPLRANIPVFVFTKGSWNENTLNQAKQLASTIQHP